MTSNLGSDIILENTLNSLGNPQSFDDTKEKVILYGLSKLMKEEG